MKNHKPYNPNYHEVYWYGPFSRENLRTNLIEDEGIPEEQLQNLVLYMICGTHGQYGRNVPLYIGKTERLIEQRLAEHAHWIDKLSDPIQIYTAAISPAFKNWGDLSDLEYFPPPETKIISAVEELLIYAHQPTFNARGKGGAPKCETDIVIFNTNKRSTLYPEVSTMRNSI
jgi:hypothetical protein